MDGGQTADTRYKIHVLVWIEILIVTILWCWQDLNYFTVVHCTASKPKIGLFVGKWPGSRVQEAQSRQSRG